MKPVLTSDPNSPRLSPGTDLSRSKVLVFDMDGVLLDSNHLRDEAFVHIFATIGCEDREQVLAIHRNNRGLYRQDKISLITEQIFGSPPSFEVLDRLLQLFSQYVRERILSCPLFPGVMEFLEAQVRRDLFVVSAAQHEEVRWVAESLDLSRFFRGIYGGPTKKTDWLRKIMLANAYNSLEVTFVGEQVSDYQAAREVEVNFVAMVPGQEEHSFPASVLCVNNFHDLSLILTEARA